MYCRLALRCSRCTGRGRGSATKSPRPRAPGATAERVTSGRGNVAAARRPLLSPLGHSGRAATAGKGLSGLTRSGRQSSGWREASAQSRRRDLRHRAGWGPRAGTWNRPAALAECSCHGRPIGRAGTAEPLLGLNRRDGLRPPFNRETAAWPTVQRKSEDGRGRRPISQGPQDAAARPPMSSCTCRAKPCATKSPRP
jgi:hypothetical protein